MNTSNVILFCIVMPIIYAALWIIIYGIGSEPDFGCRCSSDKDDPKAEANLEKAFGKLDEAFEIMEKYNLEITVVQYPVWRLVPFIISCYVCSVMLIAQTFVLDIDMYIVENYGEMAAYILAANMIIVNFFHTEMGKNLLMLAAIGSIILITMFLVLYILSSRHE